MHIEPTGETFAARYAAGEAQVVWTTLVADLETPVSAFLKVAGSRPMSFLLESVEGGAVRGRYSIIGLEPDLIFRVTGRQAQINRSPQARPDAFTVLDEPPLTALRRVLGESRIALPEALPPMAAGVFGYLGYDMVRLMEDLPAPRPDSIGIPDALLIRPTVILVFDVVEDTITIVTPVRSKPDVTAKTAWARAADHLSAVVDALDRPLDKVTTPFATGPVHVKPTSNTTPAEFRHMVTRAKDYIAAGDIFQVVLSQRFEAPFVLPPFALYRALRRINPSPYLYFLDFGAFAIAGSSPELMVKVRDGTVTIRPIAGTDQFFIERYSQVMHIVSNVEGKLAGNRDTLDALAAGFPAGTVSGAPKVRAMEIIDELEKEKRGIYAGAVGYFSAGGDMDTCIVLRTALVKDGMMYVQAGAGIVADSDPRSEQHECVNKAKALFRAAEEAKRFASAARRGQ